MAKYPALPLWTDAYLADCGHLTDAEHGRYIILLMHIWRSPTCSIPNDDEWLARKFRRSVDDVKRELRPIIDEFCHADKTGIYQLRLSDEKTHVEKTSRKQSKNQKERWKKVKALKNKENDAYQSDTSGIELVIPPHPHPHPHKEKDNTDVLSQKKQPKRGARLSDDWQPSEKDIQFAKNEGYDEKAIERIATYFRSYWTGPDAKQPVKKDWHRTWTTWVMREKDRNGGNVSGKSSAARGRSGPSSVIGAYSELANSVGEE